MDEATHVHIDFVPYITGSKRSMDTRVSLKQALAQLGFKKGGTRSATEWNQWAQSENKCWPKLCKNTALSGEQLGTHEEHLSVLDYKSRNERKKFARLIAPLWKSKRR